MTWIETAAPGPNQPELAKALDDLNTLYPQEYHPSQRAERRLPDLVKDDSIILSHSLIPTALRHAFSTYGVLMDPSLPLKRRDHELIAATVSALNRCFY